MLRIAIIGCGKVADQHVQAIHRIPDCKIVVVCDREPLMANQLGERFGISGCFSNLEQMLQSTSPEVVHITTPPQSHYSLAKQCLESGSHVYVEKPFSIMASEAESLIELAEGCGLKKSAPQSEWRVRFDGRIESAPARQTRHHSTVFFSTQFKPALNRLRIYGPRNSLMVDILTGTLVRNPGASYKSYLTYFIPPLNNTREYFRNLRLNVANFIRQRLYQDFGMKELIERFYNSIRTGGPPAIPYREIILTARIMDEIFAQIYPPRTGKRLTPMIPEQMDIRAQSASTI